MHRIRGVAANLGLEQLTVTLGQIEHLCGAGGGGDAAARSETLSQLVAQWPAALQALRALLAARPDAVAAAAPAGAAFDATAARAAARMLLQSLQRGELDDAALATLTSGLDGRAAAALAAVHAALADFDFPAAQRAVKDVLSTLDTEPT